MNQFSATAAANWTRMFVGRVFCAAILAFEQGGDDGDDDFDPRQARLHRGFQFAGGQIDTFAKVHFDSCKYKAGCWQLRPQRGEQFIRDMVHRRFVDGGHSGRLSRRP